jgi:Protein of unknown function (DUF2934)
MAGKERLEVPSKKSKTQKPRVTKATVDREAVARLAYELYLRRGGVPGYDREDWLMAEQILREERKRPAPQKQASYAARRLEDKFRK